jgi:sensor c-di-GMP phosphodiesterase-like protein
MMLSSRRRMWITALVIVLLAASGATSGFLLGRIHTLHIAQARLAGNSAKLEGLLNSFLQESGTLVDTLNASKYPACSNAEIAWFRKLIYHSTYLRDAGRMYGGKIACSAAFGTSGLPSTTYRPDSTLWDGIKLYSRLPLYAAGKWPVYLIQKGDSYVVEDPEFESYAQQIYTNYNVFILGDSMQHWTRPNGKSPRVRNTVVDRDWQGLVGDTMYATRCSAPTHSCTVAYGSYSAALLADRMQLALSAALGGLSCVLLGMIYLFIYRRRRSMSQQLRRAIHCDHLQLVYQPIVDLATRRIVEAEALLRWTDADGCTVSPEVFVQLAEKQGFVGELTELEVRHALRDFGETLRRNPGFRLNVNVTASDLADPQFLPMLERSLAKYRVEPCSLAIEVTESSTARRQAAIETIHELHRRGHCVQIDDFGTGYSSLAYLKDLSVDAIKIDQAFTRTIGTEAIIGGILPQILAMAESLGLMVIIEGIETEEQAAYFAHSSRQVLGQGWLFGCPVPAAELIASLGEENKAEPETHSAPAQPQLLPANLPAIRESEICVRAQ